MTAEQARALYNLSEFFTWRTAILRSELPPLCKYTLLVLSCHMNEVGGSCFPTITQLSDESGMDRKTVIKSIRQAVERGWLEVRKAGFAGQKWKRNTYRATIPEKVVDVVDHLPKKDEKGGGRGPEGGGREGQKVVDAVHSSTSVNSSNSSSTQNPVDKSSVQEHVKNLKAKLTT